MSKYLIAFPGGAGLFPVGLGYINTIKKYIYSHNKDAIIHYSGVSSGAVVALAACLEFDEQEIIDGFLRFEKLFDRFYKVPSTYWYSAIRQYLHSLLPEHDSYTKCVGKLFVGYTKFQYTGFTFEVVSDFRSNTDLVECIIASSTIFPLSWTPVRWYRGSFCCDGGFMMNRIHLNGYINIPVLYNGLWTLQNLLLSTCISNFHRLLNEGKRKVKILEPYYRLIMDLEIYKKTEPYNWINNIYKLFVIYYAIKWGMRLGKFGYQKFVKRLLIQVLE